MPCQRITEIKLVEELERSRHALADPTADDPLVRWLRANHPDRCKPAFVLYWIPEQAEDIYEVLLSDETIVVVEIPRRTGVAVEVSCDEATKNDAYIRRRKLNRSRRRKLEMALKLLRDASAD